MEYIYIILACIVVLTAIIIFLHLQNNIIDITHYKQKSEHINESIKLVQLSDLHSKPFKKVLEKVKALEPDVICITGDYINDQGKNNNKMLNYGKQLVDICPVYYITGNHERRLECFDDLMTELKGIGFIVLQNEVAQFCSRNGDKITILGLDENQASWEAYKARRNGTFEYRDMSSYFEKLDNYNSYKVVLSHFPENFEGIKKMNYSQYDFDIQLSGHAHGGQFILPFIGPIFSPGQGLFPKYAKGSHGDRPKLIISRGLGNAEFPFRLFNHPEINVINITKMADKEQ